MRRAPLPGRVGYVIELCTQVAHGKQRSPQGVGVVTRPPDTRLRHRALKVGLAPGDAKTG